MKYKIIKKINKGMSKDIKYIVYLPEKKEKAILRINGFSPEKEKYYVNIKKIYENIPSGSLITFEIINDKIYSFFKFIDGSSLKSILILSSSDKQYKYGVMAGKLLSKIHNAKVFTSIVCSNKYYIDYVLKKYSQFQYKNDVIDNLFAFCKKNTEKINLEKCNVLNADYKIDNIIFNKGKLYIVDLEKYEFGDPLRDFTFMYTYNENKTFAKGMIDGYIKCSPVLDKDDFFCRFKFYTMISMVQYYMWCYKIYGHEHDSIMISKECIRDFSYGDIPLWYEKINYEV